MVQVDEKAKEEDDDEDEDKDRENEEEMEEVEEMVILPGAKVLRILGCVVKMRATPPQNAV